MKEFNFELIHILGTKTGFKSSPSFTTYFPILHRKCKDLARNMWERNCMPDDSTFHHTFSTFIPKYVNCS